MKLKNEAATEHGPGPHGSETSTAAALAASEARLELACSAAGLGIWDWNLKTNEFVYSARARTICGFAERGEVTYEMVRNATHPEDFPHTSAQAQRAIDPAVRSKDPYEYRIVLPDGTVRWVLAHGEAEFETSQGIERAVRYVGTLQDITERHERDQRHQDLAGRLKLALDASRMAVWEVDLATETLITSPDLNRLFGLPDDSRPDIATLHTYYYPGGRFDRADGCDDRRGSRDARVDRRYAPKLQSFVACEQIPKAAVRSRSLSQHR